MKSEMTKLLGLVSASSRQLPTLIVFFVCLNLLPFSAYTLNSSNISIELNEEEHSINFENFTLYGSLAIPDNLKPKTPLVIIIAGSGPTDRDGNNTLLPGKNNAYLQLANELQKNGIASFRYDKRGVGKSAFVDETYVDVDFHDFVNDAAKWIKYFRNDNRFSKIIIAGHSEGALLGKLAHKKENADALISIAGAGRPINDIIYEQYKLQLGALPNNRNELLDTLNMYVNNIKSGIKFNHVNEYFAALFHPNNHKFLKQWMSYNPATELSNFNIPILIAQGTNDIQVSTKDAELLAKSNKNAHLAIIDGMNHVLKIALKINFAAYSNPNLYISEDLINEIINFINK